MKRIFLDCDGVLADFNNGARAVLGMPPHAFEQRYGLGKFWKALANAPDFFANLEPLPDAMELYEAVRNKEPIILTGLPRGNWAESQKRRWAERYFLTCKSLPQERPSSTNIVIQVTSLLTIATSTAISGKEQADCSSTIATALILSNSFDGTAFYKRSSGPEWVSARPSPSKIGPDPIR